MSAEPDLETHKAAPLRVAVLMAFLAPISIGIGDDTVSANYLFAALLLFAPDGYRVDWTGLAYICFGVVAWIVGAVMFSGGDGDFLIRQAISASLWLASAMLIFVRLRFTVQELCIAAILCATGYSLFVIASLLYHHIGIADVFAVKARLREFVSDWPQRYAVVLLFGFFAALERAAHRVIWALCAIIILACTFLTFTRAVWLGLVVGFMGYFVAKRAAFGPAAHRVSRTRRVVSLALIAAAVGYALSFERVRKAFVTLYDNFSVVVAVLSAGERLDPTESAGVRLGIWEQVVDVVSLNPVTGGGFAGPALLLQGTGAAHSEYLDVLLRTGLVGLLFYLFFYGQLLRFYIRRSPGIFAGALALAAFGFFHETTKLSYGALLFFALVSKLREQLDAARGSERVTTLPRKLVD